MRSSGGHIDRGGGGHSSGSFQPRERAVPQSPQRFESRSAMPRNESPRNDSQRYQSRGNIQRYESRGNIQRNESRGNGQRYDSRGSTQRDMSRGNINRNDQRNEARVAPQRDRGNGWRGNTRGGGGGARIENDRFRHVPGWHGGGAPYRRHERVASYGRVDRFVRDRRGYRVWIGGGLYPIFIPFHAWARFPLRVGLFIRFGGYWDPFGYWSVYDYAPYSGAYAPYYDGAYTSGVVHGVVESVDFRRGTLVINDDISRQFVTVTMPRDRRMDDVRPGDFVEFSGDWTRGGVFEAYRLDRWDEGRGGRDDGYGSDRY